MPIVRVQLTGHYAAEKKKEAMEFIANSICSNTSTLSKNIYVYMREFEKENVRKTAPTVLIDWTMIPDRTDEAKAKIMLEITDYMAEMTGENRDEIVIIFTDIPLENAMLGGITRAAKWDW